MDKEFILVIGIAAIAAIAVSAALLSWFWPNRNERYRQARANLNDDLHAMGAAVEMMGAADNLSRRSAAGQHVKDAAGRATRWGALVIAFLERRSGLTAPAPQPPDQGQPGNQGQPQPGANRQDVHIFVHVDQAGNVQADQPAGGGQ